MKNLSAHTILFFGMVALLTALVFLSFGEYQKQYSLHDLSISYPIGMTMIALVAVLTGSIILKKHSHDEAL